MRHLFFAALGVCLFAGLASANPPTNRLVPTGGPACAPAAEPALRGGFKMSKAQAAHCPYASVCQNGCGSVHSTLAFHFGSCAEFFAPCGATTGGVSKHAKPPGGARGKAAACDNCNTR